MGTSIGVIVAAIFYWVGDVPWWVACAIVAVFAGGSWRAERAYLEVDSEGMVQVLAGRASGPIWWDTVDSLSIQRRNPPWGLKAGHTFVDFDGEVLPYVIVAQLRTGDEVELWSIAARGAEGTVIDPVGRIEELLEQLQAARRPEHVRVPSAAAGRAVRLRRVEHTFDALITLVLGGGALALAWWLPVVPWWAGAVVAGVFASVQFDAEHRRYLLVDQERMVPVVAGIRRKAIWWDTVDSLSLDRRPVPSGAGVAADDGEVGEEDHVIVVRLRSGGEVPLWALTAIDGEGSAGSADRRKATEKLLRRLEALRPSAALLPQTAPVPEQPEADAA